MSAAALFQVALAALQANALRSFLAILGVIIAVASVIVMAAIGSGAREMIDAQIRMLGANTLMITPGSAVIGGRRSGAGTAAPLSEADVAAIRRDVPGVLRVAGVVRGTAVLLAEGKNWTATVLGVQEDYLEIRDWPVADGRALADADLRGSARVVLLGTTVTEALFAGDDPLGRQVRIGDVPFEVVGVLADKGQTAFGTDQDDIALVPITTARRRLFGGGQTVPTRVGQIVVELTGGEAVGTVEEELSRLLRARRRVREGAPDNFDIRNMAEFIRTRAATQNTLSVLLGATAAISLVVGGIGVMNIMLVSVTERTREIGLRMAVGARRNDILAQFLIEAVTLCLLGGLTGLALGGGIVTSLAWSGSWPVRVDPAMAALAVGAAAVVGVFFGFWPARRAARLSPIDALRHE